MALSGLPNNVAVLNFKNNFNTTVNKSLSGKTFVTNYGNPFWSFTLETPVREQHDLFDVYGSFFLSTVGKVSDILLPTINDAAGTISGTPKVVNQSSSSPTYSTDVGSTTIGVQDGSGTLLTGDLISFSNHKKVYMVTSDCNLGDSSINTLSFTPGLVRSVAPADGSTLVTVNYDNVGIQAIAENDVQTINYGTDGYASYSQDFREVL